MRALISCGVYFLPSISSVFQSVPMCALDAADGAVDVGDRLVLGRLADEDLAVLGERDDRRGGARALGVRDDRRLAALQDGDDGVGGAEVDTDRSSHGDGLSSVCWGGAGPVRGSRGPRPSLRGVRSTFLPSLTAGIRTRVPGVATNFPAARQASPPPPHLRPCGPARRSRCGLAASRSHWTDAAGPASSTDPASSRATPWPAVRRLPRCIPSSAPRPSASSASSRPRMRGEPATSTPRSSTVLVRDVGPPPARGLRHAADVLAVEDARPAAPGSTASPSSWSSTGRRRSSATARPRGCGAFPFARGCRGRVRLTDPSAVATRRGLRITQRTAADRRDGAAADPPPDLGARTLVDCAREWDLEDAVVAMDAALLAGTVDRRTARRGRRQRCAAGRALARPPGRWRSRTGGPSRRWRPAAGCASSGPVSRRRSCRSRSAPGDGWSAWSTPGSRRPRSPSSSTGG